MTAPDDPAWVGEVLGFWFGELSESDWWAKSESIDARIRARFLRLHERLASTDASGINRPRPLLAEIIVLDQFSRHLFRGSPRAFAADPIARRVARQAVAQGFDTTLRSEEQLFLYLPFEHSEDRADQAFAVNLIATLGQEAWTRSALALRCR